MVITPGASPSSAHAIHHLPLAVAATAATGEALIRSIAGERKRHDRIIFVVKVQPPSVCKSKDQLALCTGRMPDRYPHYAFVDQHYAIRCLLHKMCLNVTFGQGCVLIPRRSLWLSKSSRTDTGLRELVSRLYSTYFSASITYIL